MSAFPRYPFLPCPICNGVEGCHHTCRSAFVPPSYPPERHQREATESEYAKPPPGGLFIAPSRTPRRWYILARWFHGRAMHQKCTISLVPQSHRANEPLIFHENLCMSYPGLD